MQAEWPQGLGSLPADLRWGRCWLGLADFVAPGMQSAGQGVAGSPQSGLGGGHLPAGPSPTGVRRWLQENGLTLPGAAGGEGRFRGFRFDPVLRTDVH